MPGPPPRPAAGGFEVASDSGSAASRSSGSTRTSFDAASHAADSLARRRVLTITHPAEKARSHTTSGRRELSRNAGVVV